MTQETDTPGAVQIGDQLFTISRVGTRDALQAGRQLLGYIRKLEEPIRAFQATENQADTVALGLELAGALGEVLDPEDLITFISRITGIEAEVIGNAALEDSMTALAVAFEVNDISAIISAAQRIGAAFQRTRPAANSRKAR